MDDTPLPVVHLFTDGACRGNPGPGGWAGILRHPVTGQEREITGGEANTTNNRMELTAVIEGLAALKRRSHVVLHTDSEYVGKGITQWVPKWKAKGWKRYEGRTPKPVKNEDLWRRLDELCPQHEIEYVRVAGHSGHPENDRCDELAVEAALKFA